MDKHSTRLVFVVTAYYNDLTPRDLAAPILVTDDLVDAINTANAAEALDYNFYEDGTMVYVALLQKRRKYHSERFGILMGRRTLKEKSVVVYVRERKDGKWFERWENEEMKKLFEREYDQ